MKKNLFLLIIIFLNLFFLACSQTQKSTSDKVNEIDKLVSLYSDYDKFNGAILVVDNGEVIYTNAFGMANMEWDISNQIDTKFQIASMTKSFTAVLTMQLVAEGKLDLHAPISTYLPNYPKEYANKITIHHLLTHSAGIGYDRSNQEKHNKPEAMVNQFANVRLEFSPGDHFAYSNSGYTS